MKKIKILVTCALGDYMKGTIEAIKNNGEREVEVIGVDMNPMDFNFVCLDKFYRVSKCADDGYIHEIYEIARNEGVDIVIPLHSLELCNFISNKEIFEKSSIKVMVGKAEYDFMTMVDKMNAYDFMRHNRINTPITFHYDELENFRKKYPKKKFCSKNVLGSGGKGFEILTYNKTEVKHDKLIQEYIVGNEYTVDCLCEHGKVLYAISKHNIKMGNGEANSSMVVNAPKVENQCIKFCEAIGYHGNIGFDLLEKDGLPMIIDINPRLTATVSLLNKAGINLPYLGIKQTLGEKIDKNLKPKYGISLYRKMTDYFFDKNGEQI